MGFCHSADLFIYFFGAAFILAALSPENIDVRVFAGCKSMFSMLIRGQGALWEQDGLLDQWSVTEIHKKKAGQYLLYRCV